MNKSSPAANRLSLLSFLAITLLAASPANAQNDIQLQTLPISDLTLMHAPTQRLPFYTMIGLRDYQYWPAFLQDRSEPAAAMDPDALVHFIHIADHSAEDDGIELRAENHRLFLQGTAAHLKRFAELVAVARSEFATPITIEAAIIHHDGMLLPPSIVDPEQAQALLEGQTCTWRGSSATPANMAAQLGAHRAVSYLQDYMPEVSEERFEPGPHQQELFDGVGVLALAHRTASGDDLILQAQFAVSHLVALLPHDVGMPTLPEVTQPTVDTTAGNLSGRIKNGGALVWNANAPKELGGNVMVVVRATWTPSPTKTPDELLVVPISSLTTPRFNSPTRLRPDGIELALPIDDFEQIDDELGPLLDADYLMELIRISIEPDAWDNTAEMTVMHGNLVLAGDAQLLKKVQKFVLDQEQHLLKTTEVTYNAGDIRIMLPTLAGHGHGARHGRETTGVAQLIIEIAKKSSIVVPRIVRLFEGVEFGIETYAIDQQPGAKIDWSTRRMDTRPKGQALPATHLSTRSHTGTIPDAGLVTGAGALGKETWHVRLR